MDSRLEKAGVLTELGRLAAARELLAEVLAGEPENWVALAQMTYVCLGLGELEAALECSAAGLRAQPVSAHLWRYRGMARWGLFRAAANDSEAETEHYADALRAALRAVELDSGNIDNLSFLAVVQSATDPDAALSTVDRALEINSEWAGLHAVHAAILHQLRKRDVSFVGKAEAAYHQALRLDPDNAGVAFDLALLEYERGDRGSALDHFRMAARLDPSLGDKARPYIEWMEKEERLAGIPARSEPDTADDSESPAREPLPSGPGGEWEPEVLAELRGFDAERWRETTPESFDAAVAALREILRSDPENAAAAHELALADWLCGRRRAAIIRLRQVARWDPERARQVARHTALIESETERAEAARVEREIEAEAARERARERARQRRKRSGGSNTRELAAATRLHRPRRSRASWLLLFPLLLLLRLALHSCADGTATSDQPRTVTPTRSVPPYNPWSDPGFLTQLRTPPVVPHG